MCMEAIYLLVRCTSILILDMNLLMGSLFNCSSLPLSFYDVCHVRVCVPNWTHSKRNFSFFIKSILKNCDHKFSKVHTLNRMHKHDLLNFGALHLKNILKYMMRGSRKRAAFIRCTNSITKHSLIYMHICISTQCIFYSKFMCATHIFSVAHLVTLQSNSSYLLFLSRFNHLWWHARAAHLPIVSFHTHMHACTHISMAYV